MGHQEELTDAVLLHHNQVPAADRNEKEHSDERCDLVLWIVVHFQVMNGYEGYSWWYLYCMCTMICFVWSSAIMDFLMVTKICTRWTSCTLKKSSTYCSWMKSCSWYMVFISPLFPNGFHQFYTSQVVGGRHNLRLHRDVGVVFYWGTTILYDFTCAYV